MRKFPSKRSPLKSQKVYKRSAKKKRLKKRKKRTLFLLLALLTSCLFLFFKPKLSPHASLQTELKLTPAWDITVLSKLEAKDKEILELFTKKKESFGSLQALARYLQDTYYFAQTTIIQTGPKRLKIFIKERSPSFSVSADTKRLLSDIGEIYGISNNRATKLPHLQDILDNNRETYVFSERNTLNLSSEEKIRIEEALTILELSKKYSLTLESLTFVHYRGFKVRLRGEKTDVFVGRKPFDYKFAKLIEIQKQIREKNHEAQRIELDYEGKAFIKTSKIGEKVDS